MDEFLFIFTSALDSLRQKGVTPLQAQTLGDSINQLKSRKNLRYGEVVLLIMNSLSALELAPSDHATYDQSIYGQSTYDPAPVRSRWGSGVSFGETILERRIGELENELTRLRSNPSLEKKVAKLEQEVRKVRVASVTASEGGEKEQEDILKKYKSAKNKVFVIMPFAPIFDDVWKGGIERACSSEDYVCLRVDKISLSTWITKDIEDCIGMADVVVSDITGNNPNVMFELGWALAKAKKPIVIRQQDDPNQIPFDVHGIRYIPYANSWSGIENLFKQICKFIKSTSETVGEEPTEENKERKKKKLKTEVSEKE